MLYMYRLDNLSVSIGQYPLYSYSNGLAFTHSSAHLIANMIDNRLFFLLLCDVKSPDKYEKGKVSEAAIAREYFSYNNDDSNNNNNNSSNHT